MSVTASKAVVLLGVLLRTSRETTIGNTQDNRTTAVQPVHLWPACVPHTVIHIIAPRRPVPDRLVCSEPPLMFSLVVADHRRPNSRGAGASGSNLSVAGTVLLFAATRLYSRIAQSFRVHWSNQWLTLWGSVILWRVLSMMGIGDPFLQYRARFPPCPGEQGRRRYMKSVQVPLGGTNSAQRVRSFRSGLRHWRQLLSASRQWTAGA